MLMTQIKSWNISNQIWFYSVIISYVNITEHYMYKFSNLRYLHFYISLFTFSYREE